MCGSSKDQVISNSVPASAIADNPLGSTDAGDRKFRSVPDCTAPNTDRSLINQRRGVLGAPPSAA